MLRNHSNSSAGSETGRTIRRAPARDTPVVCIMECYLNMKKPFVLHSDGYYTPTAYFDKNAEAMYKQYLNGDYDGIIIESSDKKHG